VGPISLREDAMHLQYELCERQANNESKQYQKEYVQGFAQRQQQTSNPTLVLKSTARVRQCWIPAVAAFDGCVRELSAQVQEVVQVQELCLQDKHPPWLRLLVLPLLT
jgi:hypothetical protein